MGKRRKGKTEKTKIERKTEQRDKNFKKTERERQIIKERQKMRQEKDTKLNRHAQRVKDR